MARGSERAFSAKRIGARISGRENRVALAGAVYIGVISLVRVLGVMAERQRQTSSFRMDDGMAQSALSTPGSAV